MTVPDLDIHYDITPLQTNEPPRGPSIAAMKSALSTADSTTFTATVMRTMTKNDLIYACKVRGLNVTGL